MHNHIKYKYASITKCAVPGIIYYLCRGSKIVQIIVYQFIGVIRHSCSFGVWSEIC